MNKQIKQAIKELSAELLKKHKEALAEGYKDKICPKCGNIFLAHHHFVNCHLAHCGECPMVSQGTKSVFEHILGEITESIEPVEPSQQEQGGSS